jgi:hypothetical protein
MAFLYSQFVVKKIIAVPTNSLITAEKSFIQYLSQHLTMHPWRRILILTQATPSEFRHHTNLRQWKKQCTKHRIKQELPRGKLLPSL